MTQLTFEMPESALASFHLGPKEFAQEMRVAAAVKWYELGRFSQGRAAEIAGLNRSGFIDALSRYKVSPFQYTADELAEELVAADTAVCGARLSESALVQDWQRDEEDAAWSHLQPAK